MRRTWHNVGGWRPSHWCRLGKNTRFHLEPFELHWQPRDGMDSICISGELYNSPAFIEAYREVQELPREPGCSLPCCVAGLMLASDSTHLSSFGQAKLWPAYLYFGNDSKYHHGKPSLHLCNHIAYFHKVSRITGQISLNYWSDTFPASGWLQRLLWWTFSRWERPQQSNNDLPQSWAVPCTVENNHGQWVSWSILPWNCDCVCRWCS